MVQISYSPRAHPNPMGPSLNEKVCPAQHHLPVSSAVTEAVPTQPPQMEVSTSLWSPPSSGVRAPGRWRPQAPLADGTGSGARLPSCGSFQLAQTGPALAATTRSHTCACRPTSQEQELSSSSQKHREPAQG